jgi:hypothetical protein
MSAITVQEPEPEERDLSVAEIVEAVLIAGDLSNLTTPERTSYYMRVCGTTGLNPLTRPFEYVRLNGKTVLYAKKDASDQLRRLHNVSLEVVDRSVHHDVLTVTVRATMPNGRHDEDIGAVSLKGLNSADIANAHMKAVTKSKRRATLSICGLGLLDETEVRSALLDEAEESGPKRPRLAAPASPAIAAPTRSSPTRSEPASREPIHVIDEDGEVREYDRTKDGLEAAVAFVERLGPQGFLLNAALMATIESKVPAYAARVRAMREAAERSLTAAGEEVERDLAALHPGADAGAEEPEIDEEGERRRRIKDGVATPEEEVRDAFGLPPVRG